MENQVQLIGNLGMDPETREINNSFKTQFSLATHQVYKDAEGNKQKTTDWHTIVAWGKLAQRMDQYLKKGDKVGISGRLVSRSYETQEGAKKYITEVVAKEMLLLSGPKREN